MMEHHHRNHHHRRRKDDDDDNGRRPRGATEDEAEKKDGATLTTTALKKKKTPPGAAAAAAARRAYTRREVFAISNSTMMMMPSKTKPSVFLIIVDGVVLNVQDFSHPGGQDALEKYRGKDATRAFRKESAHGRNAAKMLNKYVVGWIVEDAKDALNNNNARRIEEEDVVSIASTSSSSSASWTYHRRNRSNSESSEEVVPRMVYLEGGENVRRESSSEDLERLSDGDGSETNAANGVFRRRRKCEKRIIFGRFGTVERRRRVGDECRGWIERVRVLRGRYRCTFTRGTTQRRRRRVRRLR